MNTVKILLISVFLMGCSALGGAKTEIDPAKTDLEVSEEITIEVGPKDISHEE